MLHLLWILRVNLFLLRMLLATSKSIYKSCLRSVEIQSKFVISVSLVLSSVLCKVCWTGYPSFQLVWSLSWMVDIHMVIISKYLEWHPLISLRSGTLSLCCSFHFGLRSWWKLQISELVSRKKTKTRWPVFNRLPPVSHWTKLSASHTCEEAKKHLCNFFYSLE